MTTTYDSPRQQWYTVQTKPRKEMQVYTYLRASKHDLRVYYPTLTVEPVNPRSSHVRAFFPGYLFVQTVIEDVGESLLRWVPGAVGLVSFGGDPAIVPGSFIDDLKRRVAQIEAAGGLALDGLKRGDRVRIHGGPFADYEAVFDQQLSGEKRVQLLLHWLGRRLKVTAQRHQITKA